MEIQKFFRKIFLFWGWVEKRPPPLFFYGGIEGILGEALGGSENFGHFGQQTVATHKAWIQGGVGVRGYEGRGI